MAVAAMIRVAEAVKAFGSCLGPENNEMLDAFRYPKI